MSKAKPFTVTLRDLPADLTVVALDCAATTGLSMATVTAGAAVANRRLDLRARLNGAPFMLRMQYTTGQRGEEMDTAGSYVAQGSGPMVVLYEMAHVRLNPSTTAKLVEARARWCFAFELKAAVRPFPRALEFLGVPASVWQAGWLGLGSGAGRPALKAASDLAAQHFFTTARGSSAGLGSDIEGDAADAVNINLWWLDHHLSGLPRLFNSKTSKARTRARTKP